MTASFFALAVIAACAKEVPPPSVQDYLDDPNSLEAAVVRCAQNRAESRYEAACVNARQAISIIEAKEERARRDAFEAESQRKRAALRRTQQAAAEARRRAEKAEQQRREAAYLAQFGELPPSEAGANGADGDAGNAPTAVIPEADLSSMPAEVSPARQPQQAPAIDEPEPASDGGNAPVADPQPPSAGDLDAVREELRRRNEESGG